MAGMWIVGEDMPRETNRVTLNKDEKDKFGMPIPNVHFDDHPNDIAMRSHAYNVGKAIHQAAGAVEVYETPPYPSTHNLGTNRMSASARDGVLNKHGQTWDVKNLFVSDGSQFTTGGAENPTLTIVTLAIRQAEYIADQMGKHEILTFWAGAVRPAPAGLPTARAGQPSTWRRRRRPCPRPRRPASAAFPAAPGTCRSSTSCRARVLSP